VSVTSGRKRILFLTPQPPFPPQQGTAIRNYNLIRQVARRHDVRLLTFGSSEGRSSDLGPLQGLCSEIRTFPPPSRSWPQRVWSLLTSTKPDLHHRMRSEAFRVAVEETWQANRPEVVQIEGLEMAQYGMGLREWTRGQAPLVIFDAHNAEYVLQQRIFETDVRRPRRFLGALYSLVQWRRLRSYEARACRAADQIVACSRADAEALRALVPGLETVVVPNGVDTDAYRPGVVAPAPLGDCALVFCGKMDFRPNVDAVLWFVNGVWPTVRAACPSAGFFIVGKDPHPRLAHVADVPGVTLTGFVEDVRPYTAAASVVVVPLLTGGGTRLKVLEAMALGKAVVSTTLGCEGIHAEPGAEVLLADGPDPFAQAVVELLQDRERSQRLGTAARAFVEANFDWSMVAKPLYQAYDR